MVIPTVPDGRPVVLRRVSVADTALLLAWRAEPAVRRYQPILQLTVAELERELAARTRVTLPLGPDAGAGTQVQWVIEVAETPVGWVRLELTAPRHGVAELGYTLGTAFQGQGLMLPAVRQALAIGFDPVAGLGLARVEAQAAVANRASRSILTRAGFQQEGVRRESAVINGERVDHAVYGLLRREWAALAAQSR